MIPALPSGILNVDTLQASPDSDLLRTRNRTAGPAFADTLAQCAAPLFSPWPPFVPVRNENARIPDTSMATHAANNRRDRRQRSRG